MGLNPANWSIVNRIQGQSGGGGGGVGGGGWGDGPDPTFSAPQDSMGSGLPSPEVLSASTGTPQQAPDPYAAYGGQAGYNLYNQLGQQYDQTNQSITDRINNTAANLNYNVGQDLYGLQQGQKALDLKSQQNEASKLQGTAGVLSMVGRGIKSGNVMLANKNAGNSSAAGAIAAAYGDQGRAQLSNIGNQYAANQAGIALDQEGVAHNIASTKDKYHLDVQNQVNGIVNDARTALGDIQARMAQASLPERFALQQEIDRIKNDATSRLQQYDTQLSQGADAIKARSQTENQAAARSQMQAGVAPENSFQYDQQIPGQFQNTGPFASGLPLFTLGKKQYGQA